jgi:hypothetical protein
MPFNSLRVAGPAALCALALAAPAHADDDAVTHWNDVATQAIVGTAGKGTPEAFLYLAFVQQAVDDAVVSAQGGRAPYAPTVPAAPGASAEAAAAAAAHRVLATYLPDQQAALDAAYAASLAAEPPGAPRSAGVLVGEQAAAQIVSARVGDGRDAPVTFTPAPAPGVWRPTPPALAPALTPWLAKVRPLLLRRPSQFRPGPPPALSSALYAYDLRETERLGGADSTDRTPAQTEIARFWSEPTAAQYQRALRGYAAGRDIAGEARLLATVDVTAADALIACWDAKYAYGFWRPVSAIGHGWQPLLVTPNHPEYPSAHGCTTAAVAEALAKLSGTRRIGLTVTSTVTGTTQRFATADDLERQIVDARVWGGLHFRNSVRVGERLGRAVAGFDLRKETYR